MPAKFVRQPKWVTADGQEFATLAGAQVHDLDELEKDFLTLPGAPSKSTAEFVVENRTEILAILKQKERKNTRSEKPAKKKAAKATPATPTT